MTSHRPFSALAFMPEEFTTKSFMVLYPISVPLSTSKRAAHTARALKGLEAYTRLIAIPGTQEHHSPFAMCIAAQMATAQISACKHLLDDRAFIIGRDRLRLTIGFLNAMGAFWPSGREMAREVKAIARTVLARKLEGNSDVTTAVDARLYNPMLPPPPQPLSHPHALHHDHDHLQPQLHAIDALPPDDFAFALPHTTAVPHVDIYAGTVLPSEWTVVMSPSSSLGGYASSSTTGSSMSPFEGEGVGGGML